MIKSIAFSITLLTTLSTYANNKTICGNTDDRILSNEARVGRLSTLEANRGCTATLISDSCAVTAGHCKIVLIRGQFNTPESIDGKPQPSDPEDIYLVDKESIKMQDEGPGKDWAVFKFKRNEITGRLPGQVQGYYDVSFKNIRRGKTIRITGYGVDSEDATGNFAQQTHTGKLTTAGGFFNPALLRHTADTMGGNSGSSVIAEDTQEIIGIHSHGGCMSFGGANQGTLISKHDELKAAIKACLASE